MCVPISPTEKLRPGEVRLKTHSHCRLVAHLDPSPLLPPQVQSPLQTPMSWLLFDQDVWILLGSGGLWGLQKEKQQEQAYSTR